MIEAVIEVLGFFFFFCSLKIIYLLEGIMLSYLTVKVICDHVSGKSKGYGFVKFTSGIEASTALKEMDGQVVFLFMIYFFAIYMC